MQIYLKASHYFIANIKIDCSDRISLSIHMKIRHSERLIPVIFPVQQLATQSKNNFAEKGPFTHLLEEMGSQYIQ